MSEHMEHAHTDPKVELEKQQAIFDRIKQQGFRAYIESLPNADKAFEPEDRYVRCIDEGCVHGLHAAGSCALMSDEDIIKFVNESGAEGFYSHEGCGAAGMYAKQHGLDMPVDEVAIMRSKHAAEISGKPYKGHITLGEMKRPADLHNARVVYYDGTGMFDHSLVEGLPTGFIFSRRYATAEQGMKEAGAAASIAFGGHGLGDVLTTDEQLYLVPIGDETDPNFSVEALTKELERIAADSNGRAVISGFTRPAAKVSQAA